MSPDQLREFEEMKRQLREMRNATDVVFLGELKRRLSGIQVVIEDGASTTGTSVAVGNVANSGAETVAEQYTGVANLYINGTLLGKIGYY